MDVINMIIPNSKLFKGVYINVNFYLATVESIVDNIQKMDRLSVIEYNAGDDLSYSFYRINDSVFFFDEREVYYTHIEFENRDGITKAISAMKGLD